MRWLFRRDEMAIKKLIKLPAPPVGGITGGETPPLRHLAKNPVGDGFPVPLTAPN